MYFFPKNGEADLTEMFYSDQDVIAQGSYDEVSTDPNVIEAYLGRPVEAAS